MQYLEDDMDELFQRAAGQYHLDAGTSAWDSISGRLRETPNRHLVVHKKQTGFQPFYFALIVMLLGLIGMLYPKLCMDPVASGSALNDNPVKNIVTTSVSANDQNKIPVITLDKHPDLSSATISNGSFHNEFNKTGIGILKDYANDFPHSYRQSQKNKPQYWLDIVNTNVTIDDKITESKVAINDKTAPLLQEPELITLNKPAVKEQITLLTKTPSTEKTNKTNGWYAGLFTIIDASKVRSMPVKNIGLGGGVLLGYNISKKISVEGSFDLQQLKYDTYGKDFSTEKMGSSMPAGMVINQLRSITSIAAFSLNIRYKVIQHKRSSVYGSAGLSAYNVTNEHNSYNVSLNGNTQTMQAMYKENNAKLPAVVGIAAGYAYNLNNKTAVRLEPYLKVPIQGIGVGNVRLTSAGLHLGITRSLR